MTLLEFFKATLPQQLKLPPSRTVHDEPPLQEIFTTILPVSRKTVERSALTSSVRSNCFRKSLRPTSPSHSLTQHCHCPKINIHRRVEGDVLRGAAFMCRERVIRGDRCYMVPLALSFRSLCFSRSGPDNTGQVRASVVGHLSMVMASFRTTLYGGGGVRSTGRYMAAIRWPNQM